MGHLLSLYYRHSDGLLRKSEAIDDDGSGLRATIEAGPTGGAFLASVLRRMHAVFAQLGRQEQALGRARLNAQATALAFFWIDGYVTARLRCHSLHSLLLHLCCVGVRNECRFCTRWGDWISVALEPALALTIFIQFITKLGMGNLD